MLLKEEAGGYVKSKLVIPDGFKSRERCFTTLVLNEMRKNKRDNKLWSQKFDQSASAISSLKREAEVKGKSLLRFMEQTDLHPQIISVCRNLCSSLST